MTKNISVPEFCKIIGEMDIDNDIDIDKYFETEPVSFVTLVDRASKVIDNAYHLDIDGKRRLYFNSTAEYMLYSLSLVDLFTSISVDYKKSLEEFDALRMCGALDIIVSNIQKEKRQEFKMLVEMAKADLINNEREIHSYVDGKVTEVATAIMSVAAPILEKIDTDKILGAIGTLK